jgi:histidinol-phosphate/aromatic aminotransferase/cobyric acid decarboxylase-like protein
VGAAVVQDEAFQQRTWDWMATVQPAFFQGLASLPGLTPFASAANFFLVQSVQPVPPLQTQLLQHHHILIRDCLSFPELGDRYFRVAVRTPAENQRLLTGLADILEKG